MGFAQIINRAPERERESGIQIHNVFLVIP